MNLNDLKKEIPYQWKIQSTPKEWKTETNSQKKWSCVAYIDARDVMDLLDEVVWPENWQSEFYQVKNTMFCKLGIKLVDWWVYKCDAWSPPDENSWDDAVIKWEPSDAFKRSAVMWWIWRFLYSKEVVWISQSDYQANKYKLTEFCNKNKQSSYTWAKVIEHRHPRTDMTIMDYVTAIWKEKDLNALKIVFEDALEVEMTEPQREMLISAKDTRKKYLMENTGNPFIK